MILRNIRLDVTEEEDDGFLMQAMLLIYRKCREYSGK